MVSLIQCIENLAKYRPIFHSEADFQHALAWEIHNNIEEADFIRLEFPINNKESDIHVDIVFTTSRTKYGIELKYKTREHIVNINGEEYILKGHSAQDIGKYDYIKDIIRLEKIKHYDPTIIGYAIFLTNDSSNWKIPKSDNTIASSFNIHEGQNLEGKLEWKDSASAGTKKDREKPLILSGRYKVKWRDYSKVGKGSYNSFKYIIQEIYDQSGT